MGDGRSPPNNFSERKGSIASTTYNDEFWRQKTEQKKVDKNEGGQKQDKLPFFQQFRPDTCYTWAIKKDYRPNTQLKGDR